jgi:hypothetical protein
MKAFFTLFILLILLKITTYAQVDFAAAVSRSVGQSEISSVAISDVNNDGRADALVATTFYFDPDHDYSIFVFLQQSDGSMADPLRYPYSPFSNRTVVQVADVNNDNRNDVMFTFGDSLGVRYQEANGTLGPVHSYYSGTGTDGMKPGDLNNDGLTDIAVCHWNDPFIKVFYQQAAGGFQAVAYPVSNAGYDELDVNDMNGDGLDDIIFMPGQLLGPTVYIYYQDSVNGIPSTPVGYSYQHLYYQRFNGIATGDLNNDGRNDLVGTMGGNGAWIALIYQNEDGTLGDATYLDSYDIPTPAEIADLNCDGKNEIIVGHNGWSFFSVWEQDNTGNYSGYELFGSLYYVGPYDLAVGDMNGDSRSDVLTTPGYSSANFVYNTTAPPGTLPTDTLIQFTSVSVDTTFSQENTYPGYSVAKVGDCLLQTNYDFKVTTYYTYKQSFGDTLFPRNFSMCGLNQIDTLRHHFETYLYENLYHTDTTVLSVDTLIENNTIVNVQINNDTLSITPQHPVNILVDLSYDFTDDTIFMYVDSLLVQSFVLEIVYEETKITAMEGLKCGAIYRDTVIDVNQRLSYLVMQSDTTLISHTVYAYPIGINETAKISDIRIYPNPARDACTLAISGLPGNESAVTVQLISMKGQVVWKNDYKAEPEIRTVIDGSKLPRGVYTVLIKGKYSAGTCKVIFGD